MKARRKRKKKRCKDGRPFGRPPLPPEQKCSERVMVYLTPGERRRLEALAKAEGLSLAGLVMRPWREKKGT